MNFACTICHDDLFFGEIDQSIKSTICGHVYHSQCLLQWTTRSNTCPHCRKILSDNNVFKLNFSVGGPAPDDTHCTRFTEAEARISALKNSLDMKDKKLQELKDICMKVNSAREKSRKGMIEVQKRMQRLINAEIKLHNELAEKNKQLEEIKQKCTGDKLANEELRMKIADLEDLIRDLTNGKLEEESELDMNREKLQEMETKFIIARTENEKLRFDIQCLKSIRNVIEPSEEQRKNNIQEMGQISGKEIGNLITHLRAEQRNNNPTMLTNEKMRVFHVELEILREEMKKLKIDLASKQDKNDLTTGKNSDQRSRQVLETEAKKLKTEPNFDQHNNGILTNLTSSDLSVFQRSLLLAISVFCLFTFFQLFLYFQWR